MICLRLVVVVVVLFPNADLYGIIKRPFLSFSIAHNAQCTFFFLSTHFEEDENKQTNRRRNIQITQCNGENKLRRIENTTKQVFFL